MDQVLEHLKDGIRRFQAEVYPEQAGKYQLVMSGPQRPLALIVTCADSRIHPDLLTQSSPGETFVTRNIGNMVPVYGEMPGGVSAVVEYAVSALEVKHIVVVGHTDCGAMKALVDPESVATMPMVRGWLRNAAIALVEAKAIQAKTLRETGTEPDLLKIVTEQNILLQLRHVATHPSVIAAVGRGEMTLSGWIYDIAAGDVRIYTEESQRFELLGDRSTPGTE